MQQGSKAELWPVRSELNEAVVISSDSLLLSLHRCYVYYLFFKKKRKISPSLRFQIGSSKRSELE